MPRDRCIFSLFWVRRNLHINPVPDPLPSLHWKNYISISFQIEWDVIMVTVFLSILNWTEFHSVQNWKENYHHVHTPFNMKGNRNVVFSVKVGVEQWTSRYSSSIINVLTWSMCKKTRIWRTNLLVSHFIGRNQGGKWGSWGNLFRYPGSR